MMDIDQCHQKGRQERNKLQVQSKEKLIPRQHAEVKKVHED
jgi:hypothetical protein